jgi:5'-nucleotidase
MKILVTNDDGVYAPGLWVVVKELQRVGRVVVVAPQEERSGAGTSINLRQSIKVKRAEPQLEGVEAYSVEGTPSDGVIIAVKSLFPGDINLVVSGINRGPNIGHDVFVSGTVGAAFQGYLHGISSLAISVNAYEGLNFTVGARLAALLAAKIRDGILPKGNLLNVNLPNLALSEIGGVEITKLTKQNYCDTVERELSSEADSYRIKRSQDSFHGNIGSDVGALQLNRISITPLPDGSVPTSLRRRLQTLAPTIYRELHSY